MSPSVAVISKILAALTVVGQIWILVIFFAFITQKTSVWSAKLIGQIRQWWLPLSFVIVLGALFGSLFYSEIAGFPPCSLCWYQRIFIYPQIILLGGALIWRDRSIARYLFPLSIIGGIIALYNSYLQYGGSSLIPCGTDPTAIDCAQRLVFEFGYVTLPLMSLTAFIFLILLAKIGK
ncbi:MAG TPA: disulfide bond formation protein B [Candidatus Paceibacterota bacterium]